MKNVILVVDDDKTNLTLAQKLLGSQYRIAAATSGQLALKYLEKHRPDLILLDINMPGMDGFEVMEKLRANITTETIPVIFLTADNLAETEIKCFEMGALDFVTKPFVPDILLSRVSKTIEARSVPAQSGKNGECAGRKDHGRRQTSWQNSGFRHCRHGQSDREP